jgi:CDP-4-dehydro-6-deoxyglucose reductase/ferredoxin-NAD(P)+ reductase (naphthalene dioxygenase ferredoxin-specific)
MTAAHPSPPHPVRHVAARVTGIEEATHDIRILRFEIVDGGPFVFSAGQYAAIRFGDLPPRDYSMASRPDDPVLEFHVRRMRNEGASAYVADALERGERVTLEGPLGDAWLRLDHPGRILGIAAGSGLAPLKSIVETALAAGLTQDIHLYFGAREERDLYLERHFLGLAARHRNFRYIPVLSSTATVGRRRGNPVEAVLADFTSLAGAKAYLAGPPTMVEETMTRLALRGLRADDMHADPFYSEAEKRERG